MVRQGIEMCSPARSKILSFEQIATKRSSPQTPPNLKLMSCQQSDIKITGSAGCLAEVGAGGVLPDFAAAAANASSLRIIPINLQGLVSNDAQYFGEPLQPFI
jgi:hypothetical protein